MTDDNDRAIEAAKSVLTDTALYRRIQDDEWGDDDIEYVADIIRSVYKSTLPSCPWADRKTLLDFAERIMDNPRIGSIPWLIEHKHGNYWQSYTDRRDLADVLNLAWDRREKV